MKKLHGRLICWLLLAALALTGCAREPRIVQEDPLPTEDCTVELEGTRLTLLLRSNPTTGFSWQAEESGQLRLVEQDYLSEKTEAPLSGAGGFERFVFEGAAPGKAELELIYRRPWEGGEIAGRRVLSVEIAEDGRILSAECVESELTEPAPAESEREPYTLSSGSLALGDLLAEDGKNVFYSPVSVDMALSMALCGAEGETAKALEAYLGCDGETARELSKRLLAWAALSQKDVAAWEAEETKRGKKPAELTVANSFWFREGTEVEEAYLALLQSDFEGETAALDFERSEAAERINAWVSEKTRGLIPAVVSPSTIKRLESVLINAVYFNGQWTHSFGDAQPGDFHELGGTTRQAQMMPGSANAYLENEAATGFVKSYVGGYRFVGVLPKQEGDFTLASLDLEGLLETERTDCEVSVRMPKLELDYSASLADQLSRLGLARAFSGEAEFGGIAPQLKLSDVLHKAKLKLDEDGTEAAAVTVIMFDATAMPPVEREQKEIVLDRPFAGLILDGEGRVLFVLKLTELPK